jgi:hypothetical protein
MSLARKTEFIYNAKGEKTAVILPISKYEQLLEDLDDLKTIEDRRHEKSVPFSEIKKRRQKKYG